MTEAEFREDPTSRQELERALNCAAFRDAIVILTRRRQSNDARVEAAVASDSIVSVRINSQRVGAEGFLADLFDLCNPIRLAIPEEEADFGAEEEAQKLRELQEKQKEK